MATKKSEGVKKTVKAGAAPKKAPVKKAEVKAKKAVAAPAAKKAVAPKKVAVASKSGVATKAATAAKPRVSKKAAVKKGARFECPVCGMAVIVDQTCSCVGPCDLLCCGVTMTVC